VHNFPIQTIAAENRKRNVRIRKQIRKEEKRFIQRRKVKEVRTDSLM